MQDAYLQAWKKLDKLRNPEKFDSWLGQIVMNTAKNELEKRKHTPLDLRADSGEEEDNTEGYDRAVSAWDNMPELEYTKEETRQLVHELIDSLSDDQRLVVIANVLEGFTAKQIAEQLGCPESTVKSRIRYGKNNIQEKAEELQKKGYKLYSIAPLPLLLLLLRRDMDFTAAEPATQAALAECGRNILKDTHTAAHTAKVIEDTTSTVEKVSFWSTTTGKVAAAVAVVTVAVGGAAVGIISHNKAVPVDTVVEEQVEQEESVESAQVIETEMAEAEPEKTEPEEPAVQDDVGWSDSYNMILQHIPDNTLNTVSEVGLYGFRKEIYDNLTEDGEQFEYSLIDLDKDGIPELLIKANTSPTTYNGMSYWMIVTYQKSVVDGNYMEMPVMVQDGLYPVTEGIASVGGSRVLVTMNEDMNEFFIISTSAGNGDSHTYVGHMEYDTGNYKWKQEEVGYYTWDQEEELEEAAKNYPVEINWVPIGTPLKW